MKEHVDTVKSNVSKQDLLDLVSDTQKSLAKGDKNVASAKLLMGLGKMAMGKYEGASRKLETVHKDPHDVQMAEDTKRQLNATLAEKLNVRRFIYGSPETLEMAGDYIISTMTLAKNDSHIPGVIEFLNSNNIRFNQEELESEINSFKSKRDIMQLLSIRDQVDIYVFIDRMTQEEILKLNGDINYANAKQYKYICEYCGMKFENYDTHQYGCAKSPLGVNLGPHKLRNL